MTEETTPPAPIGQAPTEAWSTTRKIGFRFLFAYFVLYNFPFPLSALPVPDPISTAYNGLWHALVPWVGAHLLRLGTPITIFENGSGDTTYNYVQVLCFFTLATLTTLVWSLLDRRRPSYVNLREWLRVYVRFVLCTTMIAYGSFKVIKTQFPDPYLARLVQSFGDASPMGLLWTFMGYSLPYNIFTGMAEMGAGILVGFRRTTTLGALLAISVLVNVVMLNFSYDVPVKLYSLHLLAMAIFILLPDVRRLLTFFLHDQLVAPSRRAARLFTRPALDTASRWLGRIYVGVVVLFFLGTGLQGYRSDGDGAPKRDLYGIYEVSTFVRNGDTLPPLTSDSVRWRRLIFSQYSASPYAMNDSVVRYDYATDTTAHTVTLISRVDSTLHFVLQFDRPDSGHLVLNGSWRGDSVRVHLARRDEHDLLLMNRGFHWISEEPYNR